MKPFLHLGFIQIPTFYLVLSLAFLAGLYFLSQRIENNKSFERKLAFDLVLVLMIAGFLGGRLFHVLYEKPAYYWQYPLRIFQFWQGGYVYFGGMLSATAAGYLFLKSKKENFLRWADFMTPTASLVYALGRLGCFFEGCCYGKFCDLPWAINQRHPTQLYMSGAEIFTFLFVLQMKSPGKTGKIFYSWLTLHCSLRFMIEFFRDDERGMMWGNVISISQLLSLIILGVCLYLLKNIHSSTSEKK